jgi:hypothetical protein
LTVLVSTLRLPPKHRAHLHARSTQFSLFLFTRRFLARSLLTSFLVNNSGAFLPGHACERSSFEGTKKPIGSGQDRDRLPSLAPRCVARRGETYMAPPAGQHLSGRFSEISSVAPQNPCICWDDSVHRSTRVPVDRFATIAVGATGHDGRVPPASPDEVRGQPMVRAAVWRAASFPPVSPITPRFHGLHLLPSGKAASGSDRLERRHQQGRLLHRGRQLTAHGQQKARRG